ncbi:SDR family NAD(P)-dependent oxidoreductase [Agrilactobacillus yilanensis]|uniref:SDR family NAD(P)-dependent oxidoreductase n=1 Tax=Agrilactobacillus yilanensis TaxID=2485997 RepID=A0ABW4JCK9_9LACO|nr:SDR family NAD(P)-dependent oxidoreductase [Agrilactobacillus yilanensis]
MKTNKIITLITGGNRGMGLALATKLATAGQTVIIGTRNLKSGQTAIAPLITAGLPIEAIQLDVTDPASVTQAAAFVTEKYGYLTTLINNAGAAFDFGMAPATVSQALLRKNFEVNYFGLIDVTQKFFPLLKQTARAKIINISSMMGSKTAALDPKTGVYQAVAAGYQSAKAAANMYTVQLAKQCQREQLAITVNAVDPGMVATEFGGATPKQAQALGAQTVDTGIARTFALATDFDNTETATFSNVDGPVAW